MGDLFADTEVHYEHSPLESRRFGMSVGRLNVPFESDPDDSFPRVRDLLAASRDEVVVLRYPSERVAWFAELLQVGRDLLYADSMLYFERDLSGPPPEFSGWSPEPGVSLVDGHDVDLSALVDLLPSIFTTSYSHYMANPLFDRRATMAGYQEWLHASIQRDQVVCLVGRSHEPLGFATVTTEQSRAVLPFGGLAKAARKKGAFSALITRAVQIAHGAGCASAVGPTHIQNIATQRALVVAGFRPLAAVNTVHVVRTGLLSSLRG